MRLPAYAKINLTLEILGRRDDGYHEIVSVLQTVDLADEVELLPADNLAVACDDPSLEGDANLAWRAAALLARRAGIEPRARVFIRKRIPVGMGLGGGSSDAAAALVGLDNLWCLGLGRARLAEIAGELGSDVPFFLRGGTALARGRGEVLTPLPSLEGVTMLLVCPPNSIPGKTREMYGKITRSHYSDGGITQRLVDNLIGGTLEADGMHNVFEGAALETFPGLRDVSQLVTEATGRRTHLSGAGPAMFCVPAGESHFADAAKALQHHGAGVHLVRAIMPRLSGAGGDENDVSGSDVSTNDDAG